MALLLLVLLALYGTSTGDAEVVGEILDAIKVLLAAIVGWAIGWRGTSNE